MSELVSVQPKKQILAVPAQLVYVVTLHRSEARHEFLNFRVEDIPPPCSWSRVRAYAKLIETAWRVDVALDIHDSVHGHVPSHLAMDTRVWSKQRLEVLAISLAR